MRFRTMGGSTSPRLCASRASKSLSRCQPGASRRTIVTSYSRMNTGRKTEKDALSRECVPHLHGPVPGCVPLAGLLESRLESGLPACQPPCDTARMIGQGRRLSQFPRMGDSRTWAAMSLPFKVEQLYNPPEMAPHWLYTAASALKFAWFRGAYTDDNPYGCGNCPMAPKTILRHINAKSYIACPAWLSPGPI